MSKRIALDGCTMTKVLSIYEIILDLCEGAEHMMKQGYSEEDSYACLREYITPDVLYELIDQVQMKTYCEMKGM